MICFLLCIISMDEAVCHCHESQMTVKICTAYLTLYLETGLNTPQAMGLSDPSVTSTQSPASGSGLPITLSIAVLYTMGCPLRKTPVLSLLRTTLGMPAPSMQAFQGCRVKIVPMMSVDLCRTRLAFVLKDCGECLVLKVRGKLIYPSFGVIRRCWHEGKLLFIRTK